MGVILTARSKLATARSDGSVRPTPTEDALALLSHSTEKSLDSRGIHINARSTLPLQSNVVRVAGLGVGTSRVDVSFIKKLITHHQLGSIDNSPGTG